MTESQKQREFVESVWNLTGDYMDRGMYVSIQHDDETCSNWHSWQAAYNFTLERLEAIRQIEEEIALQRHWLALVSQSDKESLSPDAATRTIIERTLGRLEAWRDEMKRGMRV